MEFISIDVETANTNMNSICQIGAAHFADGTIIEEWNSYINPQDYFNAVNVSIHGIDEAKVINSPTFKEVSSSLNDFLKQKIVVSHTHFDRVAMRQASEKYGVDQPDCIWLDSARVARRSWQEIAKSGYGLADVCNMINYKFQHHDALEDAKAAGHVILAAISHTGIDIEGWLKRAVQPINSKKFGGAKLNISLKVNLEGNIDGPLYGEVIVFTGSLRMPRIEAAGKAANIGCQVTPNVTRKTTLLVVGNQDIELLAGHNKSTKHRKAEKLIQRGQSIRILKESDFEKLIELS